MFVSKNIHEKNVFSTYHFTNLGMMVTSGDTLTHLYHLL